MDFTQLVQKARATSVAQRLEAVSELAGFESADALSVLQALGAADPDRSVRLEACRAARELRTRLSSGTMDAAARAGTGIPALNARLRSPEPSERAKAVYGCLRYESEKVLSAIFDLLDREATARVRALAVAAIGVLGSPTDAEPVRRYLQDPDLTVRAAADEALEKLSQSGERAPTGRSRVERPLAQTIDRPGTSSSEPEPQTPEAAAPVAASPPPPASAPRTTGSSAFKLPPQKQATAAGPIKVPTAAGAVKPGVGTPMSGVRPPAVARPLGKQVSPKPFFDRMTDDERARLGKLLGALSGGILAEVEKSRLADRGSRLYQEIGLRLALPPFSAPVAKALFHLAAENKAAAAAAFKEVPRDTVLVAHIEPYLALALSEEELTALKAVVDDVEVAATGRDCFPADILELVLGALRKGKSMLNELDVRERTKFRIKVDELKDFLAEGNVPEAERCALLMKREMTRLTNILNDEKNKALRAKMRK